MPQQQMTCTCKPLRWVQQQSHTYRVAMFNLLSVVVTSLYVCELSIHVQHSVFHYVYLCKSVAVHTIPLYVVCGTPVGPEDTELTCCG